MLPGEFTHHLQMSTDDRDVTHLSMTCATFTVDDEWHHEMVESIRFGEPTTERCNRWAMRVMNAHVEREHGITSDPLRDEVL